MTRKRVDSTKRETEAERQLADDIVDNGPKVEDVADSGTPSDFGSEPYDPARSIDANPDAVDPSTV